ncbi:hypothetical protein A11A3_01842 [Alcanivorax hongdengensis A-11-3]|uniref:Lipoprotein n=1 Tax=Alcanivorax hongdengensis A-11-3 TaxID=1177179 RepID=L0WFE5_9GAMM|nr:YecR family lipoprotein [Alcanivorax hongdengensis]EKF75573.1 hypothetical protein A11A3_01842 [Alcanivorax hongdengensis A-11-3]
MKKYLAIMAVTLLSGCMAAGPMQVSDGNQKNGDVVLSFNYNVMQKPTLDVQQGLQTAAGKCQSWGYTGAVPSGKPETVCTSKTEGGDCISWQVNTHFQCTGVAQK